MKGTILTIILATALSFHSKRISAQPNVSFVMNRLWCDHTTEAGEDEIYIRVIAKMSNGASLNAQQPSDHWDMNDGNSPRNVDNVTLLRTRLNPGESGTITVIIAEQDGGGSEQWQRMGEYLLSYCNHPICIAAEKISSVLRALGLTIHDTDDYIGSFSIDFGVDAWGNFWWRSQNSERCYTMEQWGNYGVKVGLNGDGSNYTGWFYFGNGN